MKNGREKNGKYEAHLVDGILKSLVEAGLYTHFLDCGKDHCICRSLFGDDDIEVLAHDTALAWANALYVGFEDKHLLSLGQPTLELGDDLLPFGVDPRSVLEAYDEESDLLLLPDETLRTMWGDIVLKLKGRVPFTLDVYNLKLERDDVSGLFQCVMDRSHPLTF